MVHEISESSFGARVKEIIRMVGSAERLARIAGMSARSIGQYAAGTSDPTRSKLVALAAAADINLLWLVTGEGPKIRSKCGLRTSLSWPRPGAILQNTRGVGLQPVLEEAECLPQTVCEPLRLLDQQNHSLRRAREDAEGLLERFIEIYDSAPTSYFTLDNEGVIRIINLAGAALLGRERSTLIDISFVPFIASVNRPTFTSFLGKVLAGKGKQVLELSLWPQERSQPLFVELEAVTSSSGQECHIAAIDLTTPGIK